MVLGRYQQVAREPHVVRLLVTALLARLPQGMSALAILLYLTPQLGYGRAGIATGVSVAGAGISNIVLARAVDRVGARRVLAPAATLYAAAMIGLAQAGHRPYAVKLAICLLIGLVTPPITSVSRGLWPRLLGEAQAQVVYGLEATAQELVYISGPAAVALIAGLASTRVAVITSGLIGLIGAIAFVTSPPFATPARTRGETHHRRPLGPAVLRYAAVGVCLTVGFNMTDVATVDFVGGRHTSSVAGVVLAVWSGGSLLGGLWFGAGDRPVTDRALARVATVAALGVGLCALAPNAVGLALILLVCGLAIAPMLARLYSRISAVVGEGSTTEAFGWLAVGFLIGSSVGSAAGGLSADAIGARWTFALAGAAILCAVPVVVLRRPVPSRGGFRQAADSDAA
jgi:MFS family permease